MPPVFTRISNQFASHHSSTSDYYLTKFTKLNSIEGRHRPFAHSEWKYTGENVLILCLTVALQRLQSVEGFCGSRPKSKLGW